MKFTVLATAVALSALGQSAFAATGYVDVPRYLAQQGWQPYPARSGPIMPSTDVAPVVYLAKGASAPSCGVLAQATTQPTFIGILTPKAGEQFPQCLGITGAAAFNLGKRSYLAVEYINRSAKDTTVRQYAFLMKDSVGYYSATKALPHLARETFPATARKSGAAPSINDGIALARAEYVRKSYPNLQLLQEDIIADAGGAFAVLTNKTAATCTFLIDAGPARATFTQEFFYRGQKCVAFVDAARMDIRGKLYYVAMYTDANENVATAIFSVDKDNGITAETELAAAAFNEGDKADLRLVTRFLAKAAP